MLFSEFRNQRQQPEPWWSFCRKERERERERERETDREEHLLLSLPFELFISCQCLLLVKPI
jgi:hypothetical protein